MMRNKIISIIRNILGGLLIFMGFVSIFSTSPVPGIFLMLSGVALLPIFYEKTQLNKRIKHIAVILPIALIIIFLISIASMPSNTPDNNASEPSTSSTNIVEENKTIEITDLHFNESEIEIDIKENKGITLQISPPDAEIESLEYCTSDEKIAVIEKTDASTDKNSITLKLKPVGEGNCEVYAKSGNGIESNKIKVRVVNNERIQAEEQARKEAEAKKEAEERAKKEAEKQAKKQSESSSQTSKAQNSTNLKSSSSNNSNGRVVYKTPTGERYHYDPDCGGKNSTPTTLDEAKAHGLTPCKKCVH